MNHDWPGDERRSVDSSIVRALQELTDEMKELRSDVKEQKESTADMVLAWKAGKGLLTFIKWFAGVSTGAVFLYHLVKDKL